MQTSTPTPTDTRTELLTEIARALHDPAVTVPELCELSERATAAEASAGLTATDARKRALDPALPQDDVAQALAEVSRASHDAARLSAAREAIDKLVGPRHEAMIEAERLERRAHAIAERDRMATRLAAEYPELQDKLVALLLDLMKVGDQIDSANRSRAESEEMLQRAEGMVRKFHASHDKDEGQEAPYNFDIFRLTQTVLPDFADPGKTAWPPNRTRGQMQLEGVRPLSYGVLKAIVKRMPTT